jgi:hypothetical protein
VSYFPFYLVAATFYFFVLTFKVSLASPLRPFCFLTILALHEGVLCFSLSTLCIVDLTDIPLFKFLQLMDVFKSLTASLHWVEQIRVARDNMAKMKSQKHITYVQIQEQKKLFFVKQSNSVT